MKSHSIRAPLALRWRSRTRKLRQCQLEVALDETRLVRKIVDVPAPTLVAIASSVAPASAASRICARFTFRTCWLPPETRVGYQADFAPFLDVDGDGTLDPGEPYGLWEGNPLTREREATALPITIRIDRAFAPPRGGGD